MASTKVTFVTGTAEVKRKDPYSPLAPSYHRLTTEPYIPHQVTYVDGKCTCCPYGYHIDLDFLNFCHDLERGAALQNLKKIQRTKRKLRKSMEMMLDEQEGIAADPNSAPPDVVHSTEAGRLLHMINYERTATQNILRHIDSSVGNFTSNGLGASRRVDSSDSDEPRKFFSPDRSSNFVLDDSNPMTTSYSMLNRSDSLGSLSSTSTVSSEHPSHTETQPPPTVHRVVTTRTVKEVVANPVIEMGTAEVRHYSTVSSAQLADLRVKEPEVRSLAEEKPITAARIPPILVTMPSTSSPKSPFCEVDPFSPQTTRDVWSVNLQRLKDLEEQVKVIPILQVRISVLKEEKRLLGLQLKANKTQARSTTTSVGVGDSRVDVIEHMERSYHSPRSLEFPRNFFTEASPAQGSPVVKTPPMTLPKPVLKLSVGVGEHSVTEPYNLQPNLPTGYTTQDHETTFEIHSRTVLEQFTSPLAKLNMPALNKSFQHSPSFQTADKEVKTTSLIDSTQPRFTINQIQRSSPKPLTKTIGVGDGNVLEGSGLHVHEKELRTVIIGQTNVVAKRNVGIECRVPTRDVGVFFMCDEAKPETRSVGVNVNYDTSGILTSFDFKGETQLRMALKDVLQRNVRSVGTNCNFCPARVDSSSMTDARGVSVGCGDESHRVDVEVRSVVGKKSVGLTARPETGSKYVGTEADWVQDVGTNTYQLDTYHKAVMTDKQKQQFAATNTEPAAVHTTWCQTDHRMLLSMDQLRHSASNTEPVPTFSTGTGTDVVLTISVGINTMEQLPSILQQPPPQSKSPVPARKLKSILKKPKTIADNGRTESVSSDTDEVLVRSRDGSRTTSRDVSPVGQSSYYKVSPSLESRKSFEDSLTPSRSSFHTQTVESWTQKLQQPLSPDLGRTSAAKSEGGFSKNILEHNLIINGDSKQLSEDTLGSTSTGLSKGLPEETIRNTSTGVSHKLVHHLKDSWPQEATFLETDLTSPGSFSRDPGSGQPSWDNVSSDTSSRQLSLDSVGSDTGSRQLSHDSISSDAGSTQLSRDSVSSDAGSDNPSPTSSKVQTEKSYAHLINNPYITVENLAEVSSLLDSEVENTFKGGVHTMSANHHISKTASADNLLTDGRDRKFLHRDKLHLGDTLNEGWRTGSVEDFMPDDIRKYMAIDPSISKDSGFGEDLLHRFSESASAKHVSTPLEEFPAGDDSGKKYVKTTKTVKTVTKSGDKVIVQKTITVQNADGQTSSVTEITEDDSGREKAGDGVQKPSLQQGESEDLDVSSSAGATNRLFGQHSSFSNLSSSENSFKDSIKFQLNVPKSLSETAITVLGDSDDELRSGVANYGSLDRKSSKLKSIMKRRSSDSPELSSSLGSKKAITFAETVIGGIASSSQEEEEEASSDSEDSTTSFEEGCYDGQQGEVTFYCRDDEAIAQGLPGAQMFDQNIRETYELSQEVRQACEVMATYLMDSTSIQTKELNASQNTLHQEWFRVSSHKLSAAHQVEDFLSSVNEISKRLLAYVVNLTDTNGNTAVHYCVSHCNFEIVNLLLDTEVCDVNKQNKAGCTPIMLAGLATLQNPEQRDIVRRLFSKGDVNARAVQSQQTALMLAASHGRTDMVKLLVEEGADLNLQDEDGSTALMCACEHGYLDIVNFLLAQPGIDANITDNENSTALSIAMEAGHKDVGVVLYKHLNFSSKTNSPATHKKRRTSSSPTPSNMSIR